MAVTTFAANHPLAMRAWSKKLSTEALKSIAVAPLIGTGTDSIIQLKTEVQKSAGDRVTFGLRGKLVGTGVTENIVLEGNEEALSTYADTVVINELVHGVRVRGEGTIDAQRVPFNLREEAIAGLTDWYATRLSAALFAQLCGYTALNMIFEGTAVNMSPQRTGFNTPLAPSTGRMVIAGNKANEGALAAADTFNLSMIDVAVERAKLANPKIRPARVNGENVYVAYLHPSQVTALRTNTSPGQWLDIQKSAYMGSRAKNPIFDGSLGLYNGVVLRECEHVTPGVNSDGSRNDTVRRAVLLGAQAAAIAFGKRGSSERFTMVEETFDYQRELGVAAKTILGIKKTVFNGSDFGVVVMSSRINAA